MSDAFVCIMGISTVFIGLICIVFLCQLMSGICKHFEQRSPNEKSEEKAVPEPVTPAEIPNRQELVAAIAAVLAEELGADVSAIRILSLKKL